MDKGKGRDYSKGGNEEFGYGEENKIEKDKIISRIGANIRYLIDKQGISQGKLIDMIFEKRNYKISQPYLSRIINGKMDSIPSLPLVTICEALDVDIQKVFWENLNSDVLLEELPKEKKSNLVYISKDGEFEKYLGTYYCYFYPTISSETEQKMLQGTITFSLDPHTKECLASFIIPMGEDVDENVDKEPKEYKGRLILSVSYNCCYCYLVNEKFGEISFLMFEGFSTNIQKLSCRMVAVLTPSAGGTRDATCLRMFLSRRKLSEKGILVVKPHLTMNSAEIIISKPDLVDFFDKMNVPDNFRSTIESLTIPDNFYILREEHFRGFGKRNMPGYDKKEFITKIRENSYSQNYYKIGKTVDDLLYKYMYKSKNKDEFFDEE